MRRNKGISVPMQFAITCLRECGFLITNNWAEFNVQWRKGARVKKMTTRFQ